MTYEEKLDIILKKIAEERKLTREGYLTKVTLSYEQNDTGVDFDSICKILLKLQDDEKIVKITEAIQPIETVDPTRLKDKDYFENIELITVETSDIFDSWYEKYTLEQKGKLNNIDWINLLKIYDIVLDIEQQLQITRLTSFYIRSLPQMVRFQLLFPSDSIGTRQIYQSYRWEGVKYLARQGVIKEHKFIEDYLGYGSIKLGIDLHAFDKFLKEITDEYLRRNKLVEKTEVQKTTPLRVDQKKVSAKVTYDPKKGELDIEGKKVKFKKDSFRAKLLELLFKDSKSTKKEWSWDEVIDEIQGTEGSPDLQKENKKKFYPACDGLSKFIAQKISINDLLLFNKSTVQINSKYL